MLFQVTLFATLLAQPLLAAVKLTPQLEADDEDEVRAKLTTWLEATGYTVAPGNEPEFQALSDDGLLPEVAAVQSLVSENESLKEQLAAVGDDSMLEGQRAKLEEQQGLLDKLGADLKSSEVSRTNALASLDAATVKLEELQLLVQEQAQKIADKDSQLATLRSELEEVLTKPATVPINPAASTPPDGSTPPAQQ